MTISWTVFKLQSEHKITIVEFQRENNSKNEYTRVTVLCRACCLMMLYISMKFHEHNLKGFQVMERTQNYHCWISKGNNSKKM